MTRTQIEDLIEYLIGVLDALDGDADLEPDHEGEADAEGEPSLGWTTEGQHGATAPHRVDLEIEVG